MPACWSMSSRSWPDGPTNGLPAISSWSPGCSPTNMIEACAGPSPKTAWVALQYNWHPRQRWTASDMDVSEIRCGRKSEAEPVKSQDLVDTFASGKRLNDNQMG